MKEFRKELLELLISHSGEFVDITHLTNKYCGENYFDTEEKCNCRLNVNTILRELALMNWINLSPKSGISTMYSRNQETGIDEFTNDNPVKARLTTHGELEYKKSKQDTTPHVQNVQNIGTNYGNASQSSNSSDTFLQAFQPTINPPIVPTTEATKQCTITSAGKWILKNIIVVIIVTVISAFIIYRLGWN
jgi:hypothetical protein